MAAQSLLTNWVASVLMFAKAWGLANAQAPADVGNIPTCLSNASFAWLYNQLNQSACNVAFNLGSVCHPGLFGIPSIQPNHGEFYTGPAAPTDSSCACNTVYYSVLSACAECQGGIDLHWSVYAYNCTTVYLMIFPESIPVGTNVPHWAYQNVSIGDVFNSTLAQIDGDAPESTGVISTPTAASAGSTPSVPSGSASSNSGNSNSGKIAGGVVGGTAFVVALALVLFWRFKSRRSEDVHASFDFNPQSMMRSRTPPPKLYNPDDPRTFPDASNLPPSVSYLEGSSTSEMLSAPNGHGHGHSKSLSSGAYSGVPEI